MKISRLTKSLMFASLVCLTLISVPSAQSLAQNEITLSFNWSKSIYYQGDSGSVTISLKSTCGDELEFTWVGIHFAWMQVNYYSSLDLSSNPQRIPSGGSITFSSISFSVPSSAPVGWNQYYVYIQCKEHHWYGWTSETWTSSTSQIYIHDAYEKTYNDLRPQVLSKITGAQSANYESPDAKSLLLQASNEYNLAVSLVNQGKWQDAVSHLQTASNFVTQASSKEEQYQLDSWRQKASDSINIANQKISKLANCESSDAKSLLQQAQTQFTDAQNSFNQATLQSYKNAYNSALQASSYADQASTKEQLYQQQKQQQQQQLILIGGVILAIAIVAIVVILMRRKKKPVTTTQT